MRTRPGVAAARQKVSNFAKHGIVAADHKNRAVLITAASASPARRSKGGIFAPEFTRLHPKRARSVLDLNEDLLHCDASKDGRLCRPFRGPSEEPRYRPRTTRRLPKRKGCTHATITVSPSRCTGLDSEIAGFSWPRRRAGDRPPVAPRPSPPANGGHLQSAGVRGRTAFHRLGTEDRLPADGVHRRLIHASGSSDALDKAIKS